MQTVYIGRSRARRVLGPFFLVTAGILDTSPQRLSITGASQRFTGASQRFTGHHGASQGLTGFMPAQRFTAFGYTGDFGYSFGYRFGYKIFLEQLCFSIDLAVSSLLLLMLLRNP